MSRNLQTYQEPDIEAPPPSFCVPNLCTTPLCEAVIDLPMTINRVYSTWYKFYNVILPANGITNFPQTAKNDIENWYLRLFIIQSFPYFITLLVLLSVLIYNKTLSLSTGLLLIFTLVFFTVAIIIFIVLDTSALGTGIFTQLTTIFEKINDEDTLDSLYEPYVCPDHIRCTNPTPDCPPP